MKVIEPSTVLPHLKKDGGLLILFEIESAFFFQVKKGRKRNSGTTVSSYSIQRSLYYQLIAM